ncbi:hypothetical protein EJ04DRAFT_524921 [Polyplosphaeria fusca]|uniref:Uncharacterized protein n=1 Tax=Polyplosphaeria fusca TaxID=682080 RepID=A0A9P4QUJ7_9PLEO|nr:hypothetical protein EJ04DRAFT_524921 [Polyplosphaeria fusca]
MSIFNLRCAASRQQYMPSQESMSSSILTLEGSINIIGVFPEQWTDRTARLSQHSNAWSDVSTSATGSMKCRRGVGYTPSELATIASMQHPPDRIEQAAWPASNKLISGSRRHRAVVSGAAPQSLLRHPFDNPIDAPQNANPGWQHTGFFVGSGEPQDNSPVEHLRDNEILPPHETFPSADKLTFRKTDPPTRIRWSDAKIAIATKLGVGVPHDSQDGELHSLFSIATPSTLELSLFKNIELPCEEILTFFPLSTKNFGFVMRLHGDGWRAQAMVNHVNQHYVEMARKVFKDQEVDLAAFNENRTSALSIYGEGRGYRKDMISTFKDY